MKKTSQESNRNKNESITDEGANFFNQRQSTDRQLSPVELVRAPLPLTQRKDREEAERQAFLPPPCNKEIHRQEGGQRDLIQFN